MKNYLPFLVFTFLFSTAFNGLFAQKSEEKTVTISLQKSAKKGYPKALKVEKIASKKTFLLENMVVPLTNPEPFISFSMRLEGANLTDENLLVEYSDDDNATWQIFKPNHENDGENPSKWVSKLLFLDKNVQKVSVRVSVNNPKTLPKKAVIRFFSAGNVSTGDVKNVQPRGVLGCCDLPPSVPRTVWGAGRGLSDNIYSPPATFTTVSHLIVHHGDSPNTSSNWAAVVASYFDYHTGSNGWADIGYNWLIAPDGTLFVGRGGGDNVQGAHYCGKNNNTMGICMIGTYTDVPPTDAALLVLEKVLAWKCNKNGINPLVQSNHPTAGLIYNIDGHRSGCATDCPGNKTWELLPSMRQRVADRLKSTSIFDLNETNLVTIYPNPNTGLFDILFQNDLAGPLSISVQNAIGQVIFQKKYELNSAERTINVQLPSNIAAGIYTCLTQVGERFSNHKLVISK